MPGARSPTIEEIENLNRYVDNIAIYTALYGAEKARLVFETDIEYITEKLNEIKEKVN